MAFGMISLQEDDKAALNDAHIEREYPWFLVSVGDCSIQVDWQSLEAAEQIAHRLLEGVAKLRKHQADRQQHEPEAVEV
jgi:hypothetical protein